MNTPRWIPGLVAIACGILFFIAVMMTSFLRYFPVETFPVLAGITVLLVVGGAYVTYTKTRAEQVALRNQLDVQRAAQLAVTRADARLEQASPPTYWELLWRHGVSTLFYAPLVTALTNAFFAVMIVVVYGARGEPNRFAARTLTQISVPIATLAWLGGMAWGWRGIARMVKRRVKIPKPTVWLVPALIVFQVVYWIPLLLLYSALPFGPEMDTYVITVGAAAGYALVAVVIFQMLFRLDPVAEEARLRQSDLDLIDRRKIERSQQPITVSGGEPVLTSNTLEARVYRRMTLFLFGGTIVCFGIAIGVGLLARQLGADGTSTSNIMALTLLILCVGGFVLLLKSNRFMPGSLATKLLKGYEEALCAGRYDEALTIADKAMQTLPNWETQIAGAAIYATAGQLSRAEQIVREVLATLAHQPTLASAQRMIMAQTLGLLTEIHLVVGNVEAAKDSAARMQQMDSNIKQGPLLHTLARLHLHLKEPYQAEVYLARVTEKDITGEHLGLHAWALAQQGKIDAAAEKLKEAFDRVNPQDVVRLSTVYLLQGYVEAAHGHNAAAKTAFENALKTDPNGANGLTAKRELANPR